MSLHSIFLTTGAYALVNMLLVRWAIIPRTPEQDNSYIKAGRPQKGRRGFYSLFLIAGFLVLLYMFVFAFLEVTTRPALQPGVIVLAMLLGMSRAAWNTVELMKNMIISDFWKSMCNVYGEINDTKFRKNSYILFVVMLGLAIFAFQI